MWFVDLSVAVKALVFEVKIVTVTARFGVFQVFIIEECCRFLHACRYWMVFSIWINVFARLWYMCPKFSTSKWWHSWQIIWPSIGRIFLRKAGCLTLHLEFCRDVVSVLNKSGQDQGLPVAFHFQNRCILRPFIKHEVYCKYLRENTTRARVIMKIEYCSWPYLLTKAVFVLIPFSESPLHFSQNINSSFLKVAGDLPQREYPGISPSVSWQAAICAKS